MRLLDTENGQFVERDPADEEMVYAILSHTWDTEKGEQTYKELKKIQRRHGPRSQALQSNPSELEGSGASSSELDRGRSSPTSSPSPLLKHSPSVTTRPLTDLVRLTPSEVEALRAFVQAYGLASPTPASPAHHLPALPPQSIWDDPELSPKIRDACAVARKNGYRYIWIDSCCIDKSSSSELSEAINSMYKWYSLSAMCYAYLADVPPGEDCQAEVSFFPMSRWFTRGWTLQELIAPDQVEFLSKDWASIGSKHTLVDLVESITDIEYKALLKLRPLEGFSVAQRLSWAANRSTTREEDRAYSLLGIFHIHMPTLYGEGDHAFRRLQEQIMQRIPDQSLFAWGEVYLPSAELHGSSDLSAIPKALLGIAWNWYSKFQNLFASSPDEFGRCKARGITRAHANTVQYPSTSYHWYDSEIEYSSTPYGVRTQFWTIPLNRDLLLRVIPHMEDIQLRFRTSEDSSAWYLAILGCQHAEYPGHLLGRVCYIPTPENSGVELVHLGYLRLSSRVDGDALSRPDLFLLSPETMEHCRPHAQLKTVYIPHHNRSNQISNLRRQPYTEIKLMLLKETRDALRSRGYSADLRDPDPDYPTIHRLTLSSDAHTVAVEFRHTLAEGGGHFTIHAEAKMTSSSVQVDCPSDSDQEARTIFWSDYRSLWSTELGPDSVRLSATGEDTLIVDLGLDFAGAGVYILRIQLGVVDDGPPAPSAVGSAVESIEGCSSSGPIDIEDVGQEEAAAGGHEIVCENTGMGGVDFSERGVSA
ncbi:hypothetical protein GSI_12603 [Ganoderma sinense ZZ0214-1]|uniref:Uncharacterized protein n=1 Tax=Ganoderma sinense ZZ0214-1 TaxID=1077348 RepID=A0A2G8RT77_9APHY|nr:hypothetical protein GSI_12603 [Ganoderma sinense ZZ0214-1]